ncbi:MAG: DNA-binding protein [Clostridia bacterium]|nr:DNA-binding protein [Clostridia bacterium]
MESFFITVTGIKNYYGFKPFKVGKLFKIRKEFENNYDSEAIVAELPFIDTVGYVANSVHTVYDGTVSAGRLYDKIGDYAYARTMFITHSSVIALVIPPEDVENEHKNEEKEKNEDILN